MKDDNELDQGFIEEDGAEQENINSKMVNLDEKEDELLKSIDKEDVKMIESFPEGENNQILVSSVVKESTQYYYLLQI